MGHLEKLLGQEWEGRVSPAFDDLLPAARAELAEKDALIERLTAALGKALSFAEGVEDFNHTAPANAGVAISRSFVARAIEILKEALSGTPTTAKLVPAERLREVRGTIEQLLCVQNGCPMPSYEEAFRLANMEAGKTLEWLGDALREEAVPPKPTPPPLRKFREGDIPKKERL